MKGQLTELIERYDADLMWFDAQDITDNTLGRVDEMIATMRRLRPEVIISDRIANQGVLGDYGVHEGGIPGSSDPREWETCMTMNDSWGYKRAAQNWKSAETLVRMLVDTTSKNGNFLLNVGPDGEGSIPAPSVERLQAVGQWLRVNGESIYGCAAAPVPAPSWGKVTAREGRLFFHIYAWPKDGALAIEKFQGAARKAWLLADPAKTALETKADGETLRVSLPADAPDRIDSVLCVETA
jgi:alpha-L-fucosidase